ncbi:putative ferritin-2 protein [Marine Group I thaumarchaeote SCGC AAA799-B03]|uniref:Putative ferritin-2 protein n=1 Tax=Marine Group I thaumarchaeote SCGC AAA799-B03 TaxID=1502289 RepID=A0A087S7G7_9ARCH|nr:putative ferritin-2 protein [Marine Group I thaumarchaeote SCGC AAA799-B03]
MKVSNEILQLLHEQIAMEANASSYYLSVASWCKVTGYEGAACFFRAHSAEEREHMLKIIQYLNELKIHVKIPSIEEPPQNMESLEQVCKIALDNEQNVTKSINKIIDTAQKENDHRTNVFLEWFVNEQIEEEDLFETIMQKFDVIGRDNLALHEIDKILDKLKNKKDA